MPLPTGLAAMLIVPPRQPQEKKKRNSFLWQKWIRREALGRNSLKY